jgi:hypothetical protein
MSDVSLMTSLGVIEGELLTYVEEHGSTPIRRLIRESSWPMPMVMMAVGALAREGLVRLIRHDLETIIKPVPEAWGG